MPEICQHQRAVAFSACLNNIVIHIYPAQKGAPVSILTMYPSAALNNGALQRTTQCTTPEYRNALVIVGKSLYTKFTIKQSDVPVSVMTCPDQ